LLYTKFYIDSTKAIIWHGTSKEDLRQFPKNVIKEAGYQLDKIQHGFEPYDWKPMLNTGSGVMEIRIKDEGGQFRVIYVAKFADAVHFLHAFQKKTQRTGKQDIELARKRYIEIG
jgi:phage-related protein